MAWPMVISFTFRFLFQLVDLIYAGYLGTEEVAAIGFYAQFNVLVIAVWVGLSAGFTSALSAAFGNRDEPRIQALKRSMMKILFVIIPTLSLAGSGIWLIAPVFPLEEAVIRPFRLYATTLLVGMPLTGFWAIYHDSIVKAHHDTRSTMFAGLIASITNVTLNTLFMFVFEWGVFGIALATVLSRLTSLWYASYRSRTLERQRLDRQRLERVEEPTDSEPSTPTRVSTRAPVPLILSLALPAAITFILSSGENSLINWLLTQTPNSTVSIAAFAVFNQLLMLSLMPTIASSVAVLPYLARNVPAGFHLAVRRDLLRTLLGAATFGVLVTIGLGWLGGESVARYFLARHEGSVEELLPTTLAVLRLLPLGVVVSATFLLLRPVFEALHLPRLGVWVAVCRYLIFSFPLVGGGYLAAPALGIDPTRGMIFGLCTASAAASILSATLARRSLREAERASTP